MENPQNWISHISLLKDRPPPLYFLQKWAYKSKALHGTGLLICSQITTFSVYVILNSQVQTEGQRDSEDYRCPSPYWGKEKDGYSVVVG